MALFVPIRGPYEWLNKQRRKFPNNLAVPASIHLSGWSRWKGSGQILHKQHHKRHQTKRYKKKPLYHSWATFHVKNLRETQKKWESSHISQRYQIAHFKRLKAYSHPTHTHRDKHACVCNPPKTKQKTKTHTHTQRFLGSFWIIIFLQWCKRESIALYSLW